MKRIKILFLLLVTFTLGLTNYVKAQGGERIQSMRIAVFTNILNLTPAEAKVFWPVYNEYQQKVQEIRDQERTERQEAIRNYKNISDNELSATVDKMFVNEQKLLDLKKSYYQEFKKILPMKKVVLINRAENQFKKMLLEKLKQSQFGD